MSLEVGKQTGAIRRVTLKKFSGTNGGPLSFSGPWPILAVGVGEDPIEWTASQPSTDRIDLASANSSRNCHISYSIDGSNLLLKIELENNKSSDKVFMMQQWIKTSSAGSQYNILEAVAATSSNGTGYKYHRFVAPIRSARIVPRGTKLLSLSEQYFCQVLRLDQDPELIELLPSSQENITTKITLAPSRGSGETHQYSAQVYFGPRDYFYLKQSGAEAAFPIGILGQIGLVLLMMLAWIARVTGNYGVAIILFSGLITLLMSPMTLISYKSMKKIQELKPKIDRIMAQHQNDQAKANQAVLQLYREHRVSPLSGCLPMLLQMPIFIALLQAISHFISLRGQRFLWISDLSLPDRVAHLPFSLPLLGKELNALPLLMGIAMFAQSQITKQKTADTAQNPTANMMAGPLLPLIFCLMFYNVPSGLVLYWLTNTVIGMGVFRLAK